MALTAVSIALAVRLLLLPVLGQHSPYLPFTLAVIVAARVGGRAPGFVATILSAIAAMWFLLEPLHSFAVGNPDARWGLALFVVTGSAISLLVGALRAALLASAESQEHLRRQAHLIDLSHDAILTSDPARRIVGWNEGAGQMYGWTKEEAAGKVIHELLKTTSPITPAEIDEILLREGRWDGELNHVTRDGRHIVTESRHILVRDAGGAPSSILEINRDITERKRAHQKLQENESLLRAVLESVSDFIYLQDRDGRMLVTNPAMLRALGKLSEEVLGKTASDYLPNPVDAGSVAEHDRRVLESGESVVFEEAIETTLGRRVYLSTKNPWRDRDGKVIGLVGVSVDVTDSKRVEEQRALALEAASLGAWEYQVDSGRVLWDERCRKMFGAPAGDAVERGEAIACIHPEDAKGVDDAVTQAIAGSRQGAYHQEFRVLWPDGSEHWIASHGRVFFQGEAEDRRAVRFVGVTMDITARLAAEASSRQKQKLESIGVLAGGIAHDFNNLLTVIIGNAESALEARPECEHTRAVLCASERAANLTKQLMAYAGKGQMITTFVDLTELVSQATELLSASVPKKVRMSYNLSQGLPCVEADPSQIEQILVNLVINAGEAIPEVREGQIEIVTGCCNVSTEMAGRLSRAYEASPGDHVWLEVRDNGSGMDEATVSRMFDPFFSTKFTGRGLGLSAVHGIVRSLKGIIEVRSSPDNGATFRVSLPASAKSRSARRVARMPQPVGHAGSAILVVEDEDMVRKMVCTTLEHCGYEVQEACNGKEALEMLGQSVVLPSLVVLDLAMPVMGGDELIPALQVRYPGLKILVSSGYPEEEARRLSPNAAAVAGFLQKPYTGAVLAEKIGELMTRPSGGGRLRVVPLSSGFGRNLKSVPGGPVTSTGKA